MQDPGRSRVEDELKLTNLRQQMNVLDGELFRLLERRFALSDEIINHKYLMGLPVFDAAREAYIVSVAGPDLRVRASILEVLRITKEAHDA